MDESKLKADREKAADELEQIAKKLAASHPKSRILSLVITKLEEAALWYAKLLREEETDGTK